MKNTLAPCFLTNVTSQSRKNGSYGKKPELWVVPFPREEDEERLESVETDQSQAKSTSMFTWVLVTIVGINFNKLSER